MIDSGNLSTEPDGGENAVILQPGTTKLPTKAVTAGPSLYRPGQQPESNQVKAVRIAWNDRR